MPAPLWQVEITRDDAPITVVADAEAALDELGVEYDRIEDEDPEIGIYLVGLLGRYEAEAHRGDEVYVEQGTGARMFIPQS